MQLPVLYKQSGRKVLKWMVETDGVSVVVRWGLVGGKNQTKTYDAKPKNVGKANATDAATQAVVEANAKWHHQIFREDYAQEPDNSNKQTRPMLAHDYNKVPHRVRWEFACTQPKLDGLRLVYGPRWPKDGISPELLSRKGDVYSLPHLHGELAALWSNIEHNLPEGIPLHGIDGEIYLHGLSLQEIVKRAKTDRGELTMELEFHVFDIIVPEAAFADRYDELAQAYKDGAFDKIRLVPTYWDALDERRMRSAHAQYVQRGYEGAMIRDVTGHYKKGRSVGLFKFKQFFDEECKILDVQKDKNGNAVLKVIRDNGVILHVTPKRTHAERKAMLHEARRFIGQHITVKYQAETADGSLQFPVGLEIREVSHGSPIY